MERRNHRILLLFVAAAVLFLTDSSIVPKVESYRPEDYFIFDAFHNDPDLINDIIYYNFTSIADLKPYMRTSSINGHRLVLGFCEGEASKGCYSPNDDRLMGCCHELQTCAFSYPFKLGQENTRATWIGCVDDPLQQCYDKMCPPGYGCCRNNFYVHKGRQRTLSTFCVPFAPVPGWSFNASEYGPWPPDVRNAASNFTDFCGESVSIVPYGINPNGQAELRWTVFNISSSPYTDHFCENTFGACAAGDTCGTQSNTYSNFPANYTDPGPPPISIISQETFCCPADHTLCLHQPPLTEWEAGTPANVTDTKSQTNMLGCASDDRGDTCCGDKICSTSSSVCCVAMSAGTYNATVITGINATYSVNRTIQSWCCPSVTQCCYGFPTISAPLLDPILLSETSGVYTKGLIDPELRNLPQAQGFCGLPLGGVDCGYNAQQAEGWQLMSGLRGLIAADAENSTGV